MKTTPFVVAIALLAHGALAANLDETAKAREHFAETYRNVIDQAVVYDQLRRDELADLEVHLDEVEKSLMERLDTDVVLFDTVKTMRNEVPIFLKKAEDYTALFEIKATLIGLESLRGQLLALALSHAEQNSPRKKEVVEAYQKLSAAIAGLDKDFDDYYSDL